MISALSKAGVPEKMEKALLSLLPGTGKGIRQCRREMLLACHRRRPVIISGEPGTGRDHAAGAIHSLTANPGSPFHRVDVAQESNIRHLPEVEGDAATYYLDHCEAAGKKKLQQLTRMTQEAPGVRLVLAFTLSPQEEGQLPCLFSGLGESCSLVNLPPLRKRREDLPAIMSFLSRNHAREAPLSLSPADLDYLWSHAWPGNLKELWSWMEDRFLLWPEGADGGAAARKQPLGRLLDKEIEEWVASLTRAPGRMSGLQKKVTGLVEKSLFKAVLEKTEGNQSATAAILGINRNTLARKIGDYNLGGSARKRSVSSSSAEE